MRLLAPLERYPVRGSVSSKRFSLTMFTPGRNIFRPIVRGRFTDLADGTRIEVTFGRSAQAIAAIVVVAAMLILLTVQSVLAWLVGAGRGQPLAALGGIIFFAGCLGIFWYWWVSSRSEQEFLLDFLKETLQATEMPITSRDE